MDDARISQAMDRIEKALARIERSAAHGPLDGQADAQLLARHETLRASVSVSLAELDALIGKLEA